MLLMNEREQGGLVFTLDGDTKQPASIVVEVPTQNQPLYYGAGDIREASARVDKVYATNNGILVHKANGDELAVPVHLSGRRQAKIYQFGNDANSWLWAKGKDGEVTISPCS